jgi:hypothetical protein
LLLAGTASSLSAQTAPVAHVLDLTGTWHLAHSNTLVHGGDAIYADAQLETKATDFGSYITIVRDDDLSRQRIVCENTQSNLCRNPIHIAANSGPPPEGTQEQIQGMVNNVLSLLLDKHPSTASKYAFTLSRDLPPVIEAEDLLPYNGHEGYDLSQDLHDLPAGTYRCTIDTLVDSQPLLSRTIVISQDGRWSGLQIGTPGLYSVSVIGHDGKRLADLMLLLAPPPTFAQKRRAFDAAKACTAKWQGEEARADEHHFLRALLVVANQPA